MVQGLWTGSGAGQAGVRALPLLFITSYVTSLNLSFFTWKMRIRMTFLFGVKVTFLFAHSVPPA